MSAENQADIIVAFDFGERRIGVATANRLSGTASPIGTSRCRDGAPNWDEIDRIVSEWAPGACVIGRPPGGSERLLARLTNFVQAVRNRYKLPVYLVDESLTSKAAEAALARQRRDGSRRKRVRRGDIDPLAACLIAQSWLDEEKPHDFEPE